jgi:hypothetical protein
LQELLQALGSDQFQARQKAEKELEKLDELAAPAYRQFLAGKPALDDQQRVARLLARAEDPARALDRLQALRAVTVLEQIGTAEARQQLEKLAQGAEGAHLTRDAKAALERLGKQSR